MLKENNCKYTPKMWYKIILVRQSSFEFLDTNIEDKNYSSVKKKFLWFGGKGAILKSSISFWKLL